MVPFVLSAVEIDVCPAQLVIQSLNEACASLTAKGLPGHEAVVAFMSDLVQLIEKSMQNIEASGAVRMLTLIPFEIRELIVNLSVFDTGFSLQLKEPMVQRPASPASSLASQVSDKCWSEFASQSTTRDDDGETSGVSAPKESSSSKVRASFLIRFESVIFAFPPAFIGLTLYLTLPSS